MRRPRRSVALASALLVAAGAAFVGARLTASQGTVVAAIFFKGDPDSALDKAGMANEGPGGHVRGLAGGAARLSGPDGSVLGDAELGPDLPLALEQGRG